MSERTDIPISAFVILALLAERGMHGYDIEKTIWKRGFKYWTDIGKTSIYNSLKLLEGKKLVSHTLEQDGGPSRKVFEITSLGRSVLKNQGIHYLAEPSNPRHDIDLGIYALPFLTEKIRLEAINLGIKHLEERRDFLKERITWCRKEKLHYPALSFERPLIAIEAEIKWLKKISEEIKDSKIDFKANWETYAYKAPPNS